MDAEDQGRRRIAQLIHDDSLQTLLAANQELIEAAPGRAQVQRAHEVVEATIARLREAMMALHPVTLEQGGFEQALGAVARQAARQGGFEVRIERRPRGARSRGRAAALDRPRAAHQRGPPLGRERGLGRPAQRRRRARARGRPTTAAGSRTGAATRRSPRATSGSPRCNERVRAAGGEFELESSARGHPRGRPTCRSSGALRAAGVVGAGRCCSGDRGIRRRVVAGGGSVGRRRLDGGRGRRAAAAPAGLGAAA